MIMAKRTKRQSGEGSWYFDEGRNRYRLRITYYDDQGRMKRKDFFGSKKSEISLRAFSFRESLSNVNDEVEVPTLEDWVTTYLEQYVANRVRPRTLEKYKSSLRYVTDAFGSKTLTDLNTLELQRFFNELLAKGGVKGTGLSTSTVRAVRRYLNSVFSAAVDAELIKKNPVKATKPPRNITRNMVILTKTQAKELIAQAGLVDSDYYAKALPVMLSLVMHTGLRQGEVFGLTWDAFDEASGTIVISKSLAHVVGKGAVFQEPKTPKSKRSIKLTSQDVEMLKTYRKWQQQYADELSDVYVWHNDLMFTSPCGFPIQASNFSRRWFRPLLRACNIPDSFTFHQLRHYHASILMDLGVPATEISSRLGHSSPRITLDFYTHELDHQPDKAIAKLEEYIKD